MRQPHFLSRAFFGRAVGGAIAALALMTLASTPAQAGWVLEHEMVMPNPQALQQPGAVGINKTVTTKIRSWHEGRRLRKETQQQGETVIIDMEAGVVRGMNANSKTYWEVSAEKYRRISMISLLVLGVQATPEGGLLVPDPLFQATGDVATVNGRKAFEMRVNGNLPANMKTSVWLSEEVKVPISKLVAELKLSLAEPKSPGYQKFFKQWANLEGYPVQTVTTVPTPQGTLITSETLLSYKQQKIPASMFQVPKGYTKTVDPITQMEAVQKQLMSKPATGIGAPLPRGGGRR